MWILKTAFWSIARRLFGWGDFKKVISRTIQVIILILVLMLDLTNSWVYKDLGIALAVSTWVIIQYWTRAVGEILDAGLNPTQDKDDYNLWFRSICNFIVRCLNKILPEKYHIHKYYGVYDWIYSSMRNLWGLLPAMIIYPSCWWIAIINFYPVYLECYKLFEKYPSLYRNKIMTKLTINQPKNLAEIFVGATFSIPLWSL